MGPDGKSLQEKKGDLCPDMCVDPNFRSRVWHDDRELWHHNSQSCCNSGSFHPKRREKTVPPPLPAPPGS